jgi:TRAP-type uncharacterized transport system fused permease subunit
MMQSGTWTDTVYMVFKAVVAVCLWGAAAIGYLRSPLNWPERAACAAASLLLVVAVPWTDEAGFALGAAVFAWHVWRSRAAHRAAAAA